MSVVAQAQYYDAPPHRRPLPAPGSQTRTSTFTSTQHSLHSRSRTSSSSIFPQVTPTTTQIPYKGPSLPQPLHQQALPQHPAPLNPASRRTLSNVTSSTASTGASSQERNMSLANSSLQRTPSNRSGQSNSPTSYVSLMRKQKATVWCDRSQHEDPRIVEQRRQAKLRAAAKMAGGGPRQSVSTASVNSSVRSMIRHHGVPKATPYAPANMSGTGVPMRLSATEVDEEDSDDDSNYHSAPYHRRTGSGRSSLNSGARMSYMPHGGRFSTSSTPPSNKDQSPTETLEDETPVPGNNNRPDYFSAGTGLSTGSGSSGERENSFGGLGSIPQHKPRDFDAEKKASDDLRRRGSVDDRSMTMSGNVRLFVANPDADDSD